MRKQMIESRSGHLVRTIALLLCFLGYLGKLEAKTVIDGRLDISLGIDSFSVIYSTDLIQQTNIYSFGKRKTVHVHKGTFVIELEDSPLGHYVVFDLPRTQFSYSGGALEFLAANPIFLNSSTRARLSVLGDSLSFSGADGKLVDAQYALFRNHRLWFRSMNQALRLSNLRAPAVSAGDITRGLRERKDGLEKMESLADSLLDTDFGQLSQDLRNRLLYDYIGRCRMEELRNLNFHYSDPRIGRSITEYYIDNLLEDPGNGLLAGYRGNSYIFPSYLAAKIGVDLRMSTSGIHGALKFNLPVLLNVAFLKYTGTLYDQVGFACYQNWKKTNPVGREAYMTLVSTVSDSSLVGYYRKEMQRNTMLQKSFAFSLENEKGDLITNRDLIGKVVWMDFWFTGCTGCLVLHRMMGPVKEHFKNDPRVVFLSINVDNKEGTWKRSILSGDYTDTGDIKLWTGEQGSDHPMVRYYEIASYPSTVLVNGNGEIVMRNPPDPRRPKGKEELIELINSTLGKSGRDDK